MKQPRDLNAAHAWRGALVAASLNVAGMPGDYLLAHDVPNMPWYPAAMSSLVGIALIVLLLINRERATVRFSSMVFLVNTAAILPALWITSGYWATAGRPWTPFEANKLGALAVALLAPELGVGLAAIGGFAAMPVAKFYVLDPEIRQRFPVGEPWTILFYALFGSVLLWHRLRSAALEREALHLQAEVETVEQLAQAFLRLRDYANTPIQTIAFTAELMRRRHPESTRDLARLTRAVEKLIELTRVLTRYESARMWTPGNESLDTGALSNELPKPGGTRPAVLAKSRSRAY